MRITVTCLLKNHGGHDVCSKYLFCINGSSIFCSISCISVFLNAYDYHYNHLPHSRPAGSRMDIPASANMAYELSKFSSQLKEALYE